MTRRAWLLALLVVAGCTEEIDGLPTTTAASPVVIRPNPDGVPAQPVSTPAPAATPPPRPLPTTAPVASPVLLPYQPTPTPATPDPNAPSPTPKPTPRPTPTPSPTSMPNLVPFAELATADVPSFSPFHPTGVRLRGAAAATAFFLRAFVTPPIAASGVDYTTREVLGLYAPASDDPSAGCTPTRLDRLFDLGATLGYTLRLPDFGVDCPEVSYDASYQFVTIARTDKPIPGFTEFQP